MSEDPHVKSTGVTATPTQFGRAVEELHAAMKNVQQFSADFPAGLADDFFDALYMAGPNEQGATDA